MFSSSSVEKLKGTKNTDVSRETRITVGLLPLLRIIDRVIVINGIRRSEHKTFMSAGNLRHTSPHISVNRDRINSKEIHTPSLCKNTV